MSINNTALLRWTPDGTRLLIADQTGRIGSLPRGVGEPTWVNLRISPPPQRPEHLAIHPDGRQLVFMTGGIRKELRVLEGFLR